MRKKAIITFDYEVFLGRDTGSIEKSVIRPTRLILDILNKNNGKAIFFVDATWLLFLRENFPKYFSTVSRQLKDIAVSGSSVELHLHPQWIKAQKTATGITFSHDERYYRLHSLNDEEIFSLVVRSKELLEGITGTPVRCFRAGGWCIDPFVKLKSAFESSGIKYDFSVAPGMTLREGRIYDFDFSGVPRLPHYRFRDDTGKPDEEGPFTEIPVSTYFNNPFYRLVNRFLLRIRKDTIFGDGKGIKEKSFFSKRSLINHIAFSRAMLSIDKTSKEFFRYLLACHFRKDDVIVIVSHPKTTSGTALGNLEFVVRRYITLNSADLGEINNIY